MSESAQPRTSRRRWWVLSMVIAGFLLAGFAVMALIARECCKHEFCVQVGALLSERLDVEVALRPMRSHGLVFLDCPSVEVRDRDGRWAFRAQKVSFELLPASILAGGLGFRSLLIQEAELWLGGDGGQQGPALGGGEAAEPGRCDSGLPWWLEGRLQRLGRVPVEWIRIPGLKIRGHEATPEGAIFEVVTSATARLRDGRMEWRLEKGQFEVPGQKAWRLAECVGVWEKAGLRVERGLLVSPAGAELACRSREGRHAPGELALEVEARELRFDDSGMEVEEAIGPVSGISATVKGVLLVQFPEVQRFQFFGDVEMDGLSLGESKVFRLLSGQTGEERLRCPQTRSLKGKLECAPGVIRLSRLTCVEEELFRLEGWLSAVGEEVVGVLELALPAPVVGKIPGGKPEGFSYPASGWSWARLRVEGKRKHWQEDLSQRLMAQISRNIPVAAGPPAEGWGAWEAAKQGDDLVAANRQRQEEMERLFFRLIGD